MVIKDSLINIIEFNLKVFNKGRKSERYKFIQVELSPIRS